MQLRSGCWSQQWLYASVSLFPNMDFPSDLFHGWPLPSALESSIICYQKHMTANKWATGTFFRSGRRLRGSPLPRKIVGRPTVSLPAEQKQASHLNSLPLVFNASSFHLCRCARRLLLLSGFEFSEIHDLFKRAAAINNNNKNNKKSARPEATAHNEIFLPSWVSM